MNAKQARAATAESISKKEQEVRDKAVRDAERQKQIDEYSRDKAFPDFMERTVHAAIVQSVKNGDEHAVVSTTNKIVADLVVAKLLEDEYDAHCKSVFVPECREYGDSGEGMHDAYTAFVIHVNWGEGGCPTCEEEFHMRRRW